LPELLGAIAAAVHRLPMPEFAHLPSVSSRREHIDQQLAELESSLFVEFPEAAEARDWVRSQVTESVKLRVLHGDLLPQNVLVRLDFGGTTLEPRFSVIDWECARIGDPAYDFSIITRAARQPHKIPNFRRRMLDSYAAAGGQHISERDIALYEMLLILGWLNDARISYQSKDSSGHAPEHYAQQLSVFQQRNPSADLATESG
ncbi:MAG TPA: aminoglycoside phosphotransferase family protein, partial [Planctomycetaceae bacterium]|nr:aminoglycoside phosphotransferase family protein [Planctomycetaceae bacterium]